MQTLRNDLVDKCKISFLKPINLWIIRNQKLVFKDELKICACIISNFKMHFSTNIIFNGSKQNFIQNFKKNLIII